MLTGVASSLPFLVFFSLWFFVGARLMLKRVSSIELSEGHEVFRWKQRTFRWSREFTVHPNDVTAVVAKTRWYKNEVIVTTKGKTYALGDLMKEDVQRLARELRHRLGIAESPV